MIFWRSFREFDKFVRILRMQISQFWTLWQLVHTTPLNTMASHYSPRYLLPNPFANTLCYSPYMLPLPLVTSFLVSYFIYFILFKLLDTSKKKIQSLGNELELLQSYKPHNQLVEYLTIYWDLPHEICLLIGRYTFDPTRIPSPTHKNGRFHVLFFRAF